MTENSIERLQARIHLPENGTFLIGLSGGADSVALTMMTAQRIREGTIRAAAVHVNHGLRGAESDEDERFARDLCRELGIACYVYRANLSGRSDEATA